MHSKKKPFVAALLKATKDELEANNFKILNNPALQNPAIWG